MWIEIQNFGGERESQPHYFSMIKSAVLLQTVVDEGLHEVQS